MRVLKGTLTFVLGMVMGIVLFLGAIVGTVYAVATAFTIGDLSSKAGLTGDKAIFDQDSDILDKTLWEVGTELFGDVQQIGGMSINEIAQKYGLSTKINSFGEISGIDISPIFDVPISQLPDSLGLIVDNITLNDIGELASFDFGSYGIPALDDNLYSPVTVALDALLSSIDGENMTLRQIEDNFGLTLGENQIFDQIKDTPLSSFGDVINGLEVGAIIDASCDKFVLATENALYVKTGRYEVVDSADFNTIKDGATTYIYGMEGDTTLERELRFVVKTKKDAEGNVSDVVDDQGNLVYIVDNSCYNPTENDGDKVYYRYYEYEAYNPATMAGVSEFYLKAYGNHFVDNGNGFTPVEDGYVPLSNLYTDDSKTPLTVSGNIVNIGEVLYFLDESTDAPLVAFADSFGVDPATTPDKDTRLDSNFTGYKRVAVGTSDVAIQAIAYTTVSGLNNATDVLMGLKLGDLIEVTDESSQILQTLKDKPLNDLSDSIDDLYLKDVVEITVAFYAPNENGDYAYVGEAGKGYYTLYSPDMPAGTPRFEKYGTGDDAAPDFIPATNSHIADHAITKYYWDVPSNTMMVLPEGSILYAPEGATIYVKGTASSKVLQRLANISIGDFSNAFDELILGDVIDVDMDKYEALDPAFDFTATSPFDEFYVFEDSMYRISDDPAIDILTKTVYRLAEESESSAILKKLALVKVNDLSNKMNTLIDDMRLDEVMDIDPVLYMPHDEGTYVYVKDGGYYTLYNPAVHADSQRYVRVTGKNSANEDVTYRLATNEDGELTKFYWDATEKKMVTTDNGTDAYVEATYSSLMLQRFARVKISGFSNALDGLALSDVMDIDADVYEKVADTSDAEKTYFYYDNGLYIQATTEYIAENPSADYYVIKTVGTSHIVMKKMAYLEVSELGNRMEDVINDLYLADLMDIFEFDIVKEDGDNFGTAGDYLVPADKDYTEYIGDEVYHYSFIRDDNGKYYLRENDYFALSSAQAEALKDGANTVSFDYVQLTAGAESVFLTQITLTGNGYFLDSQGVYHNNPALCAYIITQGIKNGNTNDFEKVYMRVDGATYSLPKYVNPLHNSNNIMYVVILGQYVLYDANNFVHADLDKYLLLSDGYALVEENANDTRTHYYYDLASLSFTTEQSATTVLSFIKHDYKLFEGGKFYYYYAKLDSAYNAAKALDPTNAPPTFSKQLATIVYVETDKDSAELAFYDKKLVEKDTVPEDATNVSWVKGEIGHIVTINGDSAAVNAFLALMDGETKKITYSQAQSAAALKAFAVHDVKVSSLDTALKDFTVGDMIDIAPDSLFDDDEVKLAKLDSLGNVFQTKMQNMTIKNILDWGNITTLSDEVLAIIGEATLEDFFASLSYSAAEGIHVDIVTLYKNIYARQRQE